VTIKSIFMNLNQLLYTSRKNKEMQTNTGTRVNGYKLFFVRTVWLTLYCLILLVFLLGIPNTFKVALTLHPETVAGLQQLGLQASFPAIYIIALDTIMILVFACFAALIVWRRPGDWMIMFVSLTLLSTAMLYTAPAFEAQVPLLLLALLASFAEICQVALVYLFPDGHFVPRWMWVLLLPLFVWRPLIWAYDYLPNFFSLKRSGENFFYIPQNTLDLELFLLVIGIGFIAQVYRYWRRSTPIQRQQTKLLLLGMILVVVILGAYLLALNTLPTLQQLGSEALIMRLISRTINHLALVVLPLAITFSILRYRLWDIDTLINRTLVYGTLTGILILVYFGCVIALQVLLHGFTGGSELAVVGSTLTTAILFHPLRRRIQQVIDRRFYRSKYDTVRTIESFSEAMSEEVDLTQLTERLLSVVQETMHPTFVSLWIRKSENQQNKRVTRVLTKIDDQIDVS
jgi:hypothetical protein